jgi:hypothetical protein
MKTTTTLVALFVGVGASTASAQVRHVPPAGAEAGKQVELVAEAPAATPTLVAHVRSRGAPEFTKIELVRKDDASWVAVVPAAVVVAPGLDYYVTAGEQVVFASPEWPHTMPVNAAPDTERRTRDQIRTFNRRSRVHAMGEWVEYGTKTLGTTELVDRYYRFDADFAYRLWTYPLEEIRVGYTRLLGETRVQGTDQMCPTSDPCTARAGYKVAGWFELGLAAVEGIRLDARMAVMATQDGFAVGGRGEARLGDREASHVALGVEYLADVGTNGFFRLGWGTVPKLPMSATVEITNLPASHSDTGVRLYYDIAREVAAGVRLGLRVGYAARNQSVAGFTGGAGATVEF